jgi:two-component system, NtrC family, sensor kinase
MKHWIFILLFIPIILKAQEPGLENLSPSLKRGPITLAKDWKYNVGDNPEWADPNFDDSRWRMFSDFNLYNKKIQRKLKKTNVIWYRKKILIDSTTTRNLVAYISQSGASEIYLDGELIHSLGKVNSNPDSIVHHNPATVPLSFPMKINKEQVLAVRFSDTKNKLSLFQENTRRLRIRVQKEEFGKEFLLVASDSLFDEGFLDLSLNRSWRFHPGDDLNWAKPDFDDRDWKFYNGFYELIHDSLWDSYGWFRYRFAADSSAYAMIKYFYFFTFGAAEVYLDGKLVQKYGTFSTKLQGEKLYSPMHKIPSALVLQPGESHVVAVRFSYHKGERYKILRKNSFFGFIMGLVTDNANQEYISAVNMWRRNLYIFGTMLFLIVLLHGFLFLLVPAERSNLYIAIVVFLLFLRSILGAVPQFFEPDILQMHLFYYIPDIILFMAAFSMFPLTISSMFNHRPRLLYKLLVWLFPLFAVVDLILRYIVGHHKPFIVIVFTLGIIFFSFPLLIKAWKKRQKGVWFVAGGFLGTIVGAIAYIIYQWFFENNYKQEIHMVFTYIIYASVPIGLTGFMASRFRELYTGLEQKVHERTWELKQSLDDLRSTQAQLIQSEKMASLGELTAGIAHEIQNPLNFVNNFSEVNKELLVELKDEIKKGNFEEVDAIADDVISNEQKINHHGKRADAIVKGMLQHSRSSNGHKEPADINTLADEYLRLSYHGLRAKDKSFNADFKLEADESLPKVNIIPQDIGRVLLNLINNAFYAVSDRAKHNENGYRPEVSVITKKLNDKIEIRVTDNGYGIPKDIREKIFQPFFTTKPTGQGTGLGLSLAYDIVKAHGGEIKVETKNGEGTVFLIRLPIH